MKKSDLQNKNYYVMVTTTDFEKRGTKWVLIEEETQKVDFDFYNNVINSKEFFTNLGGYERHTKSYTELGYVVTVVNSISPDKTKKTVRKFKFCRK